MDPATATAIDSALAALQQAVADAGEGVADSPAVASTAAAVAAAAAAAVDTSGASLRASDYGQLLQDMQARNSLAQTAWVKLCCMAPLLHRLPCCGLVA